MWSNCCGSEPSYLSEELCGLCLEHAVFDDEDIVIPVVIFAAIMIALITSALDND